MAAKVIHFEVVGQTAKPSRSFYSEVFDWRLDTNNPSGYGMVARGAGIARDIGGTPDGSAGLVTFYMLTDDPKATLEKVERIGGKVVMLTQAQPD